MIKLTECRQSVLNFAVQMEIKLRENDHKGGWKEMADEELIARMLHETGEILMEKACITGNNPEFEAVDVANFAMMLWDNITNPKSTTHCNHESSTWDNDTGCLVCDDCNEKTLT